MNIQKIHLDDIERCYCASHINIEGTDYAILASENPTSLCKAYYGDNFENSEEIWVNRGGCMSIIPIPEKNGEFLGVNEFYLKVSPSKSKLVWGKREDGKWLIKDLFNLPFLHRFDIYNVNGINYLICATIALDKENKEDWSKPGQIYGGILPDNVDEEIKLEKIADGLYRNHGYCQGKVNGRICGYFGSDQGIVRVSPPYDGNWKAEKIMDGQIGEIALCDIDNDGNDEIMTIEPFHGNTIKIYKQDNGKYVPVYQYDNKIDFAHSLIGNKMAGKNCFIAGIRRLDAELIIVTYENGAYKTQVVEKGVGPANLDVIHRKEADYIIAANHTKNEAAIYKVTE